MSTDRTSTSSADQVDHEKAPGLQIVTNEKSIVDDDEYDYEDPKNYSTNYVDEYNPRGLRVPTKAEEQTLRRVIGKINYAIFLICVVEFSERASYYSVTGILTNFIQRPLPKDSPHGWGAPLNDDGSESAGALNRGLQAASALTNLVTFLAYVVPLFGGYLADTTWGRWKTIQWGVVFGGISHVLFIISAAPSVIANGKAGLALCILAIFTLAFGSGFIKPNLLPLMLDQYPESGNRVKVLKSGEKVIVDREKTLDSVTLIFYWAINIGAFFQLATSYCERRVGFWLAFFVPLVLYLFMPIAFWLVKPKLVFEKPSGSIIGFVVKILVVTFSGNFVKRIFDGTFWEYAKPSVMRARGREYFNTKKQTPITWTDQHVLDVKQTLDACKLFVYYIFYNLADSGLGSVETSLAGAMNLNGVPNDLFSNFNPLAIIVVIPILDYILYPLLRRYRINFRPIHRVFLGFVIAAMSQVAGAVLQHRVYQTSPCGNHSTNCPEPSPISAWQASSVYILAGASECFAMTTIYALAYTRAAPAMKGLTSALFLLSSAISAAISLAVTPALKDPYLVIVFAVIGGVTFLAGVIVLIQFFNLHKTMEKDEKERIALGGSVVPEMITPGEALEPVSSVHSRYPLDAVRSLQSR
ncbi:PTR2 [Candida metapsilosis]|uniref:PTR2 n=1 Tax=Candida metapsilosis TaxID=273372 RepID=A0A8H7ZDS1_9ASCO|nr:PTR2 [Candida metapsilosis]